ncbi:MAG TPA: hypothetical protein VKL21_05190 [Candidatus Methanoperedens sp.]|nr:hypothetical protein [Candidatus Methanoperedens sp.]
MNSPLTRVLRSDFLIQSPFSQFGLVQQMVLIIPANEDISSIAISGM